VFEGYITEAKLKKLKAELHKVCKTEEDSIIIYRFDSLKYSQREILGIYEQKDNFL
jgi:CRISPR-associated protein Cas2